MRIKKYVGSTVTEALGKVKDDLGAEAVILNTRTERRGSSDERVIEVTAALDDDPSLGLSRSGRIMGTPSTGRLADGIKEIKEPDDPTLRLSGPSRFRILEAPSTGRLADGIKEIKESVRSPTPLNRTALACLEASERGKRLSRIGWPMAFVLALIGAVFAFKTTNDRIGKLHADFSTLISTVNERASYSNKGVSVPTEQKPLKSPVKTSTSTELQSAKDQTLLQVGQETSHRTISSPEIERTDEKRIENIYETAMGYYKEGKFDEAILKFREILDYSLPHPLKDNAQYWIGECYYDKGDYQRALNEFEKVKAFYPNGKKILDAQIKIAYCYYKLGEDEKALDLLMHLMHSNLKDPYVDQAIQRMIRRIESKLKDREITYTLRW